MYKCAIILSAGQGTRIKSNSPKVLHKVCGKEMVNHVIDNIRKASINDINLVIGKGAELVKEKTENKDVSYSMQHEQLGTGHAVKCSTEFLRDKKGCVLVFAGDAPLIDSFTIKSLVKQHKENKNSATLVTSIVENPKGYGRVIRDDSDFVLKIVEDKECSDDEAMVREINSAMYCFDIEDLLNALNHISNNNNQGEYYLTDVIEILKNNNKKIGALITNYNETIGVNSRLQLAETEKILRDKINKKHLENGVTLIDPASTYIGIDVEIGKDTIVYPGVILEGNTVIGSECLLMQNTRINNSNLDNNVTVESSIILDSTIGSQTTVGPFDYIRPGFNIGSKVK
ncbi:bifunctional UDP-N-acetylglucosamine pyrophosphorylase/glucosamine-1-phosphate N-acetyltransferase [Clostridium sardiniense]|nr:bifunctional UDP-N-acetylglucosamine pyrophosphorylase/glucosamine-1-phosphate N-acetyltransferase [Clostridium sardiniense]